MHKPRLTVLIHFGGGCCKEDLLPSLLRASAGLKPEQNKHRRPNGRDQKAGNQAWAVMGKVPVLTWEEWGFDTGGFSLTVSLGSRSLRKQEVPKSLKGTLPRGGGGCWQGPQGPLLSAGRHVAIFWRDPSPRTDAHGCGQPVPSPPCTLACFIPSSMDAPRTEGQTGQLPHAAAKGLAHQLSRFSGGTVMGRVWKPP